MVEEGRSKASHNMQELKFHKEAVKKLGKKRKVSCRFRLLEHPITIMPPTLWCLMLGLCKLERIITRLSRPPVDHCKACVVIPDREWHA